MLDPRDLLQEGTVLIEWNAEQFPDEPRDESGTITVPRSGLYEVTACLDRLGKPSVQLRWIEEGPLPT